MDKFMILKSGLVAVALVLSSWQTSHASWAYSFRFNPSSTSVNPGTQNIDIFLDEVATPGFTRLSDPGFGLRLGEFIVNSDSNTIIDEWFTVFADAGIEVGEPPDNFVSFRLDNQSTPSSTNGTLGTQPTPSTSTIKLGGVSFSLAEGQTANLTIAQFGGFKHADEFETPFIVSGTTISITAVPEPSSIFGALGMAVCGGWYARARFKRRAALNSGNGNNVAVEV